MTRNLVSTDWLAENLLSPHIVIIDVSWHLPTAKRDAKLEFADAHIPGACFYDLDAGSDTSSSLPHMLPSAQTFAADMGGLGVGPKTHVIAYDSVGLFSAARLWWMLKVFGHSNVSVLDGGMKKWLAERRPIVAAILPRRTEIFIARFDKGAVRSMDDVAKALSSGSAQVADARSPTRFRGEEPEPRPGVKPGHMPGAFNVHYAKLLNADGTLKQKAELAEVLAAAGVDLSRPVITSCGSGVTAAILILALEELGHTDHALYDGSWAEWGASENPVART